jgi:hypothetical protein
MFIKFFHLSVRLGATKSSFRPKFICNRNKLYSNTKLRSDVKGTWYYDLLSKPHKEGRKGFLFGLYLSGAVQWLPDPFSDCRSCWVTDRAVQWLPRAIRWLPVLYPWFSRMLRTRRRALAAWTIVVCALAWQTKNTVMLRASSCECWQIRWTPFTLRASPHKKS